MELRFARIIYYLLHPLLVPSYTYLVLVNLPLFFNFMVPPALRWFSLALIFGMTAVLPAITNHFITKLVLQKENQANQRISHTYPYLLTAIFFYLTTLIARWIQLPGIIQLFALCSALVILAALFISYLSPLSMHTVATGGALGVFLGIALRWQTGLTYAILGCILASGLAAFAVIRMEKAKPLNVYLGFLSGALLMCLLFYAF